MYSILLLHAYSLVLHHLRRLDGSLITVAKLKFSPSPFVWHGLRVEKNRAHLSVGLFISTGEIIHC
jgi:hypothetical protein